MAFTRGHAANSVVASVKATCEVTDVVTWSRLKLTKKEVKVVHTTKGQKCCAMDHIGRHVIALLPS